MDQDKKDIGSFGQRKLVAILFADIQGYTAMMQKDEILASTLLKRFHSILTQDVALQNGTIIQFWGDGALCTFEHPLDAINSAIAFQKSFISSPEVPVRVGIHMGTIILAEGMAYSDSVNLASRIESIGIPGSILVSKRIRDEIKNQPKINLKLLGLFHFKNVIDPVEVYAIDHIGLVVPQKSDLVGRVGKSISSTNNKKWFLFIGVLILALVCIPILIYFNNTFTNAKGDPVLESLPRLAILPFENLRGENELAYLGLALTDEIISDLSYVKDILVRPSSAIRKYENTDQDAPSIGRELKVDYLLGGSYLKEEETIKLAIELVKVESNERIWGEEIETSYLNTFQLQDTVAKRVLQGLKLQFSEVESQRTTADISEDPLAYEYYLRGLAQNSTLDGNQLAIQMLHNSVELDSLFAPAWSELGWRVKQMAAFTLGEGLRINEAEEYLLKALKINEDLLSALNHLTSIYVETGRTDKAVESARHALTINPNSAENHYVLGYVYRFAGYLEKAEHEEEIALSLDPGNLKFNSAGVTQIYLGKYETALARFKKYSSGPFSLAWQGQIYLRMGHQNKAMTLFEKVIEQDQQGIGLWVMTMKNYIEGNLQESIETLKVLEKNIVDAEQIYNVANLYGLVDEEKRCILNLRKAVSRGFFCYPVLLNDSFLDSIRDDPAFKEILEEAKYRHEDFGRRYF